MFDPQFGLINQSLRGIGVEGRSGSPTPGSRSSRSSSPRRGGVGYFATVFLAGLRGSTRCTTGRAHRRRRAVGLVLAHHPAAAQADDRVHRGAAVICRSGVRWCT
jgi:hypothetical protein